MKKIIFLIALLVSMTSIATAQTMTCVVHKGEWIWVRSEPSSEAAKISTIRYGHKVDVSEIKNKYAHVTLSDGPDKGLEGWVDVSYLEKPIKEETWIIISDGPLNKRETPDGRFMSKIKSGTRISVLGWRYSKSGELWAKVYLGGYVKAQYLQKAE